MIADDGDGRTDVEDPGCSSHLDSSELDAQRICDDGLDNDGDGAIDHPADPGCKDALRAFEDPQCDDGDDNDNDGTTDWDGGPGGGAPDPHCNSEGWRNREAAGSCGIGWELTLLFAGLSAMHSRLRTRGEWR